MTDPRAQSFIATIDACFTQAAGLPGASAPHEAIFECVPALKAQIEQTLAHDLAEADAAQAYLRARFEAFQRGHQIARLAYSPLLDGRYPYRDAAMNPIHIGALSDSPERFGACEDPRRDAVLPFVDPEASDEARAAAYRDRLVCRRIDARDLSDPREQVLVGQRGLFAARRIRAGECLGVYGGRLLTPAQYFTCIDDDCVLAAPFEGELHFIDGENVLAMANTRLAYDARGLPVAQAEAGYNMQAVRFYALSRCDRRFSIGAMFAAHEIEEGAELRWNYGYSAPLVERRFGPLYRAC